MTILATKCNGEEECKYGIDEEDCEASRWILAIVLGLCLVVFVGISVSVLYCSKLKMVVVTDVDFNDLGDKDLEVLVSTAQGSMQRRKACEVIYDRKLVEHDRIQAKALNALKVS